jgi:hypothetical protein
MFFGQNSQQVRIADVKLSHEVGEADVFPAVAIP